MGKSVTLSVTSPLEPLIIFPISFDASVSVYNSLEFKYGISDGNYFLMKYGYKSTIAFE
jgi:hypothetical protein